MASILLAPGESFEHFHRHPSYTILVSGDVRFITQLESRRLNVGERVYVDANHSHTIVNIGNESAQIDCVHSENI